MVAAGTPALVDVAVSAAAASAATWARAMPSVEHVPAASPAAPMDLARLRPVLIRAATIEAAPTEEVQPLVVVPLAGMVATIPV